MDRRKLLVTGLVSGIAAAGGRALAQDQGDHDHGDPSHDQGGGAYYRDDNGDRHDYGPRDTHAEPYTRDEIYHNVSDFFGVTAENTGALIEKLFHENGQPTAYIAGTEGGGAFFLGARYGEGLMYMKNRPPMKVFWQGPNAGFDIGGNASRVFTLCYDLEYPDAIFRRFPGIEGRLT